MIRSFADLRYRVYEKYREWHLGINTSPVCRVDEFHAAAERAEYTPVPFQTLENALSFINPGRADCFFDYGCGKGRGLVIASQFAFNLVSGIELVPELHALAEANLRRTAQRRRCAKVEVILGDATVYELPKCVTVAFLWNPFCGAVLDAVMEQIHASLVRKPRHLKVLYMRWEAQPNPFDDCDWLVRVQSLPTWPSPRPTELSLHETIRTQPGLFTNL